MTRDCETALWGWLRESLQTIAVPKHIQRIEDSTKSGTPDVEGCIDGRCFWIELKVAYEQVKSPVVRVRTTDKQVYFAHRRTKVGGLSWFLIRVGKYPRRSHYLIHGSLAEQLFDKPIPLPWLHENSAVAPDCTASQILIRASQPK